MPIVCSIAVVGQWQFSLCKNRLDIGLHPMLFLYSSCALKTSGADFERAWGAEGKRREEEPSVAQVEICCISGTAMLDTKHCIPTQVLFHLKKIFLFSFKTLKDKCALPVSITHYFYIARQQLGWGYEWESVACNSPPM